MSAVPSRIFLPNGVRLLLFNSVDRGGTVYGDPCMSMLKVILAISNKVVLHFHWIDDNCPVGGVSCI